jgi:hypothetical protein
MSVETQTKSAVSVAEMARMVGLSRARFYQLQKAGVFPLPVYSVSTRRPIYVEEAQKVCLEVRRRNLGINGVPILFYARRNGSIPAITKKKAPPRKAAAHADLLDGLQALGLTTVTVGQVTAVVKELYPNGISGTDSTEVLRTVFVHLKRQFNF